MCKFSIVMPSTRPKGVHPLGEFLKNRKKINIKAVVQCKYFQLSRVTHFIGENVSEFSLNQYSRQNYPLQKTSIVNMFNKIS